MRRAPLQQRSAERVALMLDAAASLLDEGGYDALSTRAVAVRTGLPIGSIYRFFGDKRALAQALARRNLARFLAAVAAALPEALPGVLRWEQAVDVMVEEYLRMKRNVPGFAVIDFDDNREVAGALGELLATHLGLAEEQDGAGPLRLALLIAVEAADAALRLHHDDPAMIEETKELLRAYLVGRLPPAVGDR